MGLDANKGPSFKRPYTKGRLNENISVSDSKIHFKENKLLENIYVRCKKA